MIAQKLAIEVLNAALATGGDYAEIYLENTISENVTLDNGKVDHSSRAQSYGCGIRILQGFNSVYGFTSDLSRKSLLTLAGQLSRRFEGERKISVGEANGVALRLRAAGNHYFRKNIAVLRHFVRGHRGHAAGADDKDFSHYI